MQPRHTKAVPTGPALKGEQVAELWVFIWSTVEANERAGASAALDEARRLAVAFDRAVECRDAHDWPPSRFTRDQGPVQTALLADYLLTRSASWRASTKEDAPARLAIVTRALALLCALLQVDAPSLAQHAQRLGVGPGQRSVFRPEVREGVTLESLEEGPTLPAERKAREDQARTLAAARWKAESERPGKRRTLEEVAS